MTSLQYNVQDNTLHLEFVENIISTNVEESTGVYKTAIAGSPDTTEVIADLSDIKMIDSQGLNLLIGIYQECQKRNCSFVVTNPSDSIKKLFSFVKLNEKFGIPA